MLNMKRVLLFAFASSLVLAACTDDVPYPETQEFLEPCEGGFYEEEGGKTYGDTCKGLGIEMKCEWVSAEHGKLCTTKCWSVTEPSLVVGDCTEATPPTGQELCGDGCCYVTELYPSGEGGTGWCAPW